MDKRLMAVALFLSSVAAALPQLLPAFVPQEHLLGVLSAVSFVGSMLSHFTRSPMTPKLPTLDPLDDGEA